MNISLIKSLTIELSSLPLSSPHACKIIRFYLKLVTSLLRAYVYNFYNWCYWLYFFSSCMLHIPFSIISMCVYWIFFFFFNHRWKKYRQHYCRYFPRCIWFFAADAVAAVAAAIVEFIMLDIGILAITKLQRKHLHINPFSNATKCVISRERSSSAGFIPLFLFRSFFVFFIYHFL